MNWKDAFRLAVTNLRGSLNRTLLTILGLAIGVGSVLTVLTLGAAGEERVEDEIAKLGVDKVWIRSEKASVHLTSDDAAGVLAATGVPTCAGVYGASMVSIGDWAVTTQLAGFDEGMNQVYMPKLLKGRSFRQDDFEAHASVCLIDEVLAERSAGTSVGDWLTVGNRKLRIVGVMKGMTNQVMGGGSGLLIMPLSTYLDTFPGHIAEITLSVPRGMQAEKVADKALESMQPGVFRADTLEKEINAAREVVRIFVMVLVCVAIVCMMTGGIGVMNMMLVSIRERRNEIGLFKAIGATCRQIGLLFLLEAWIYAMLGGIGGVLLGIAMIHVFSSWIGLSARVDFLQAMIVLISTSVIGIGFGVFPAIKAAGMKPVEALRSE